MEPPTAQPSPTATSGSGVGARTMVAAFEESHAMAELFRGHRLEGKGRVAHDRIHWSDRITD